MARYPLVGGPCDGQQSINFTVQPPVGYIVLCQTHEYAFTSSGTFRDTGTAPILASGFAGGAHQLDGAWRRLMRAYGVTMPRALRRSAAGRSRMKRVVR